MAVSKRKILKTVLIVICALLTLVLLSAGVNALLTGIEMKTYTAPGRLVEVNGGKMHVYSEGIGVKKVILLSGFGTACPVLDFRPLVRALSDSCTVIVVEYFGYGWSDGTDTERSAAAVVEEIRSALAGAGFEPPYILVPHSLSGLYALHYADRHPDEVEAVIGLDVTVPGQFEITGKPSIPSITAFLRETGLIRVASLFSPGMVMIPDTDGEAYTAEEKKLMRIMACRNTFNPTVLSEAGMIFRNAESLRSPSFPSEVPAVMIVASGTQEKSVAQKWKTDWETLHRQAVTGNVDGRVIVLGGRHYIYRTKAREIGEIVKSFLN